MQSNLKQILFSVIFIAFSCLTVTAQIQKPTVEVPTIKYCDIVREPTLYDGKLIRVEAFYTFGFEASFMYEESCADKLGYTWISFDPEIEKTTKPETWKKYQNLTQEVFAGQPQDRANCKLRRLRFLWTGIFTGIKPTVKVGERIVSQGFGHMNSYSFKFTVREIEEITKVEESVPCN